MKRGHASWATCEVHGQRRRVRPIAVDPRAIPAPGAVERAFTRAGSGGPDRRWLADIPSISTRAGWRYLGIILDSCSRIVY